MPSAMLDVVNALARSLGLEDASTAKKTHLAVPVTRNSSGGSDTTAVDNDTCEQVSKTGSDKASVLDDKPVVSTPDAVRFSLDTSEL